MRAAEKMVSDRFWRPFLLHDDACYVKLGEVRQKMSIPGLYKTLMFILQRGRIDVF